MKNLAPEIVRQRLLIEGRYSIDVTRDSLKDYMLALAAHLNLRTYGEPVIYAPATGMGKEENSVFDAFLPLIDSGISAYIWSKAKFFSIIVYTCKNFDEKAAIDFTREFLDVTGEVAELSF